MDRMRQKEFARERRNQKAKFYRRTYKYMYDEIRLDPWARDWYNNDVQLFLDRVSRNHKNRARCSCSMCGNPRRQCWSRGPYRLTIQEQKFLDIEKYEMKELYEDIE